MSSSVMMRQMRTIYHDDPHEEPCEEDAHNENANNDDDEDDGVEQNSETTNCTKKEEYMPISHELDMNEDSESHESISETPAEEQDSNSQPILSRVAQEDLEVV